MSGKPIATLPVLDCNECGACCTQLVYPPFYGPWDPSYQALEANRPDLFAQLAVDREERQREFRRTGVEPWGTPCSWFEPETRRCKHYDHRPDICRDFNMGSDEMGGCLDQRRRAGL